MSIHVAGLDLGQSQDYTALVIMELHATRLRVPYEALHPMLQVMTTMYHDIEIPPVSSIDIRHVERFPLGTKYQDIAVQVAGRLKSMPTQCYLAVDQTGVGVGVMEMLSRLRPVGITITGGQTAQMVSPYQYRVPKRDLVDWLQVHFQNHTLRIADRLLKPDRHGALLMSELANFRAKISISGHDTYEAWREADHDDLVLATAIAAWFGRVVFDGRKAEAESWLSRQGIKRHEISPI